MTKKARFIKSNKFLSDAEKEQTISFFSTHPNYEKYIDWNSKAVKFKDFKKIFKLAEKSGKNQKKREKENPKLLFNRKDFNIIAQTDKFLIALPLSRKAFIFINSYRCGGERAKWCTGDKYNKIYWQHYSTEKDTIFYFVYFLEKNNILGKKLLIEYSESRKVTKIWFQNGNSAPFDCFAHYLNKYFTVYNIDSKDKQMYLKFDNVVYNTGNATENNNLLQLVNKAHNENELYWIFYERFAYRDTNALFSLGKVYLYGNHGTKGQNFDKAKLWFKEAAARGHVEAKAYLNRYFTP